MEITLDVPLAFTADRAEPAKARLRSVRLDGGLEAVVETDVETARRGLFHDTPENRLDEFTLHFDATRPVLIDLELRPERRAALPPAGTDLRAWVADLPAELLREDAWNAREVWQEQPLDDALGGGAMRIGYRTAFSPPRSEIDALKRHGLVSRTVVEALIENGLPVDFQDGAFELQLTVGEHTYRCRLAVDDEAIALALTVAADGASVSDEVLDAANDELMAGAIERTPDGLRFVSELQVDVPLVNESWVIETLRAGVSVLHSVASA
ncbi:MAG TPA: hypothetical protein VFZ21_01355 [Gemmatimonadaceae bacterium]|nr:hypothetical protein [Gemmatimonadaceae bacterium]